MTWLGQNNDVLNQKILRFIGVGFLNTLVGYGIYAVFIALGVRYLFALLAATIIGVIFNYFSFGRLVFNSNGSLGNFVKFIIGYTAVYFANAMGLTVAIYYLGLNPYLGGALCLPATAVLSWLFMQYWVFKNDR